MSEDGIIVEAETSFGIVTVVQIPEFDRHYFEVRVNGESKHGRCNAADAMRALGTYLQSEGYWSIKHKMGRTEDGKDTMNPNTGEYHVMIDDQRTFYVDVALRTADAAIEFMRTADADRITHLYMDHDLGCVDDNGQEVSGYHVLLQYMMNGIRPQNVILVTMNPVGRQKMADLLIGFGYESNGAQKFFRAR